MSDPKRISMVTPFKTDYYREYANAFRESGKLRKSLLWTREGFPDIPPEQSDLLPVLGKASYAGTRLLGRDLGERFRFSLYPQFDRWAAGRLVPGDDVFSSYGYANECFRRAKSSGGRTFLDGGNSHPDNFWSLMTEEHSRWGYKKPPIPKRHYERSLRMMEDVDYVFAPSDFVAQSFASRGFSERQILKIFYPVNLSIFKPVDQERPKKRPFTIVNTGALSFRKGTPYLLEAFRMIHRQNPDTRFLLTKSISEQAKPFFDKYNDLPIEWSHYLSAPQLAERLRNADLFILPSLEEGLVRTAIQALACGLPCILTPNTGSSEYVEEGINGSIVPIRDPKAIADAALSWWVRIEKGYRMPVANLQNTLNIEAFRSKANELMDKTTL